MTTAIPPRPARARRLVAEFVGTGALVAIVVGSGAMASRLSPDDTGLQLLENSLATALGLAVLIALLAPVSGAHFNPVVSAVAFVTRDGLRTPEAALYIVVQVAGAVGGALLANAMFDIAPGLSGTERAGWGTLTGEVVATAGLVLVILGLTRAGRGAGVIGAAVGAYIGAAYWFTSSTAFANPAVTVGRIVSDSFAGIAPASAPPFIAAQLVGGAIGLGLAGILFPRTTIRTESA
ncbi:MAG TPA: MIP/aquaporin family protein [Pseudolysinimonas sp.]|nr:MIP/aquaporin family protein [Pseudolysinimonas sp.]